MIGCWYKDDIYSHNCGDLIEGLKGKDDLNIKLITSNCNCFSSAQRYSITREELQNNDCEVIKIPYAPTDPTKKYGLLKYYVVKMLNLNFFFEIARGISFFRKTKGCNIIHFDQVLRSFGFLSFITLLILSKLFRKKVVVTVHELDPLQKKYLRLNKYYNYAEKVIVHSKDMKDELIGLGVKENKIEIVHYGVSLEPIKELKRDQFIFFGGHRLLRGKGFETLLNALKILQSKGKTLRLVIYVGEGCIGLDEGKKKVSDMGLDRYIEWTEFLHGSKLTEAYQGSIGCIIPYTGGSGRYPATSAMANATPVIATRKASLPEYVGESGIYIKEESDEELVNAIISLMDDPDLVKSLGTELRKRAEKLFSSGVITDSILKIYHAI
jgi:glycosyltransferase involved in cell wall biosynthesis